MPKFDVEHARKQFPALQQKQVFFDNAGGSQILGTVIDSISKYLSTTNVQLGATYSTGTKSTQAYSEGFAAAAKYVNADVDEVVIGPSTTQLFRNLSLALKWQPNDEIIVSKLDHEANIASWVGVAERLKLKLKWWTVPPTTNPKLDPHDLKKLLTPRTRFVACTHASNILGTINDIKSIAETVHTIPGAMLCVDGVAYMPHRRIDVQHLGVDFYAFSWYKVYGPHVAMLYASRNAQREMGSLGHFFNPTQTLENKLGLAGASYELTQAIPQVARYFSGEEGFMRGMMEHEERLAEILLSYLRGRRDVTIFGEEAANSSLRVPTISFAVRGWNSKNIVESVERESDFGFRWGHFYSKRLCDEILRTDENGVVRVSMVHYNTEDEIREFVKTFDRIVTPRSLQERSRI